MTEITQESVSALHAEAMRMVVIAELMLRAHKPALEMLVNAERDMHSSMHITNPTLYREAMNSRNLEYQLKLAKAALDFLELVRLVQEDALTDQQRDRRDHQAHTGDLT